MTATTAVRRNPSIRSRGENLVAGEVVLGYVDEDGHVLKVLRRRATFPVGYDEVRTRYAAGDVVAVSFMVRGRVKDEAFEQEVVVWFTGDASQYVRASPTARAATVSKAGLIPTVVLIQPLAPLVKDTKTGETRQRRIEYGDGRSATITGGDVRRIDFDDGESVTVTDFDITTGDAIPSRQKRYAVPPGDRFELEILDSDGNRVDLNGRRYRQWDTMPEWD